MNVEEIVKKLYREGITKKFCFAYQIENDVEVLCTNSPGKIENLYKGLVTKVLQREITKYEFCFFKRLPDGTYVQVAKKEIR